MKNEFTVIWPVYIDSNRTISEGRKIAKDESVDDPSLKEISKACYKLHLQPAIEKYKSYPGSWYEHSGRVTVKTDMKKNELLRAVASKINNEIRKY